MSKRALNRLWLTDRYLDALEFAQLHKATWRSEQRRAEELDDTAYGQYLQSALRRAQEAKDEYQMARERLWKVMNALHGTFDGDTFDLDEEDREGLQRG